MMTGMIRRRGIGLLWHRLHLLVAAWRLHARAERLAAGASWEETRSRLLSTRFLPTGSSPTDAAWAATWAVRVGRRLLGRRDTCLLRALVAGTLVADRPDVTVRVGVHRPWSTGDLLDAHAWLTVAGRAVGVDRDRDRVVFEEVAALRLERVG